MIYISLFLLPKKLGCKEKHNNWNSQQRFS
jgi:hypothetical protein